MKTTTSRPIQDSKRIEERVSSALAHRIRVEVLMLLNEGVYTADDLADLIGESRQTVHHHLKVLLSGGSIEVAKVEKRRNAELFFYRAVRMAEYSEKDLLAMSPAEREAIIGVVVQLASAEIMAALAAGKLSNDPKVVVAWRWFNLDGQGRRDLADEQVRMWARVQEIEAESTNRRVRSGEEATSFIVAEWGFERAKTAPVPASAEADKNANSF